MEKPKISVVVGSYNRCTCLKVCIDAVREELNGQKYEIIVVDGGSTDGSVEWLVLQKDIISIIQHNRGEWNGKKIDRKPWAYFINLAFKCSSGKYICMLSDDSIIVKNAINNGVNLFDGFIEKGINLGAVAFYFRDYPVRKKYAVAINLGNLYVNHGLFLNQAIKDVGYADENYNFYFADTDLALKIKQKGYKIIASKTSFVEHYFEATPEIRASNNDDKKIIDRKKLIDTWRGISYQYSDYDKYLKHIGYWDEHPIDFHDKTNTIAKLITAHNLSLDPANKVKSNKLISIVTVTYNDAKGLKRTIESIRTQTAKDLFEYIIIDGRSTDETLEIINSNSDIVNFYISEKDTGIYNAMNKGIRSASCEYVIFMNAGDTFFEDNIIERVAKELEDSPDICYGDRNYISEDGSSVYHKARKMDTVYKQMPYCHQASFVKRIVLEKFPFNETYKYSADYNQIVEMYKNGLVFKKIEIPICNFYAGGKSESGIRPYLEVLKIQMDNVENIKDMEESTYYKKFKSDFCNLTSKIS